MQERCKIIALLIAVGLPESGARPQQCFFSNRHQDEHKGAYNLQSPQIEPPPSHLFYHLQLPTCKCRSCYAVTSSLASSATSSTRACFVSRSTVCSHVLRAAVWGPLKTLVHGALGNVCFSPFLYHKG